MKYQRRQCIYLLLQVILLITNCLAENLTLSINFERRIFVTSDAFLSLTLDPATLLSTTNALIENIEGYANMVQGLAPAYVRLGGPESNSYTYDRVNVDPNSVLLETHSTLIHRWAEDAGLNVIACISPRYVADKPEEKHSWEPTKLEQLLSFNNRMGHNANWQLGYECQTRCDLSGSDLGRYVAKLRETLKTYPRYSDCLITGPDIVAYKTEQQREYLRDYLNSAGDALTVITWHPDFADATVHGDNISVRSDNIATEKNELYQVIGDIAANKPLWIAESKLEAYKHTYLGALTWTRRLGNAAQLGVQVVMRQFVEFSATPDYWVSWLHKALVGREVLEVKVQSNNENHVHFYSQCTKPSALYEKGALTIFGVNLMPREVTASLKGFKIKTLHEYILSPDSAVGNKMFAEKILLNGEPLELIDGMKLPDLNPEVVTDSEGLNLKLAAGNIGFWVIPNAKVQACTHEEEERTEGIATRKLWKRRANVIRHVDEKKGLEKEDVSPSNSGNLTHHTKQERTKRRSDRTEIRRKVLKSKLYRRIKRLLQKNMQEKEKDETSSLQRPFTIFAAEQKKPPEETEKQQNSDNGLDEIKESENKTETNEDIQNTLKKYRHILLKRKTRAEAESSLKPEVRDINNAVVLISKIEALLQLEKEATSNDVKDEARNVEDTVIGTNGKFNEIFGELAKTPRANAIEKIEEYFNILRNLLEDNESTTKNVENYQVLAHESLTNKERYRRDLSKESEVSKEDVLVRRSRTDDLKNHTRRKMRRRKDHRTETSLVASDLKNFDNHKNNFHDLFRQHPLKRFLRGSRHRSDPQDSMFKIQRHGRATRDVDRIATDVDLRREAILRKSLKIDNIRDYLNERKSKRKADFKREGLLRSLNPRITDSGESDFKGFLQRDPIKGFLESDVFVTTGDSSEQSSQNYDYLAYDKDDSRSKEQQQERKPTVESVEDVFWMKADDDQKDYTPNEFFENINLSNAKIRDDAKIFDDLYEAEFALSKRESDKDNDNNGSTVAAASIQSLDNEETKKIKERSIQYLMDHHDNSEDSLRRQTETPIMKYDFIDYQTSDANFEAAKQKLNAESKFPSFFYQPALDSTAKYDYDSAQVSGLRSNVEYVVSPVNDEALYNRRDKRSDWKKLQELFVTEMIKDADNDRNCHRRAIRAPNWSKNLYKYRTKRDQMSETEFAVSGTADANTEANPDFARIARNVPTHMTKEEFDRIMTGEILSSTSVIEIDSDNNDKRDTGSEIAKLNRSYRKANKAMRTIDVTLPPTTVASGTSDISAQQVMEEQTFFRAQSSTAPSEIKETTYDPAEAALQVFSRNKESGQEVTASDTESARQATTSLCEQAQEFEEEIQRKSTDATIEGGEAKDREYDGSNRDEETTERIAAERVTTETSKRTARKTANHSRSNRSKSKIKEATTFRQDEDDPSSSDRSADRARVREENELKRVTSIVQDFPKSQLRELVRYQEYLARRAEQAQKRSEKLKERRERIRNDPAKIADEQTRNLKRREAWGRFCDDNDFCRLFDQEKLLQYLMNEIEARVDVDNNDDFDDDDDVKEDRFVNSLHHFLQHSKIVETEREPAIAPASSGCRIFAINPSKYSGGEPVLELHEKYLDLPKYPSKIKFQTQPPIWTLKGFHRTPSKPAIVYGDQQIFKPYDDRREYERNLKIKDDHERGNAVVLYVLDKHRQHDLPEDLAALSRIYLSALDRRDINQVVKGKRTSDSNNDDSDSALTTARKVGLPKSIDEKNKGTNRRYKELDKNFGKKINRSYEMNDKVKDDTDIVTSNKEIRNVKEDIVDNDFEASRLLDTSNTTPRSRRNAESQTTNKYQEQTRLNRADERSGSDRDKYICMKKDISEEISSEQLMPLYQLTRLPSDAVLFRKPNNYVTSSSRNFDRQGGKQSPRYVVLMPDDMKDVRQYEMLGAKNSERSSERFEVSSWLDRYLPKRITNAINRYLNDAYSDELDYENLSHMLRGSAEETSDEEVSYSSDYSDESGESNRKVPRNVADEIDRESREKDQQHGAKNKDSQGHLKMQDRIGSEEQRAFMPLSEENEKAKRRRRQTEIDQPEINKFIATEDAAEDKNDEYYLQQNSINEKSTIRTDYLNFQKDGKVHDDLLEEFMKSQRNDITSTENEKNSGSSKNSITKSDKKSPSFIEETIPKLQNVIIDGLEKAKDLTESVEQFVDNFEENFNKTSAANEETSSTNETSGITDNPFHLAITNIKKLFTLFTGISRILHV